MKALNLKLVRELWQVRMQMLSIALVVASGMMTVITMRGSYESLVTARDTYYAQTRFADVWAPLVRAPLAVGEQIAAIPDVTAVDVRISFLATLDLPDVAMPALGRFISLPAQGRPLLNDIVIKAGRYIDADAADEVIVSEKFATARQLRPGDSIRVVINGRSQLLEIVAIANSPEHTYAVPPGSVMPEDARYGVFWMNEQFLGPANDMESAFNEVALTLSRDANPDAILEQVDAILKPYGGLGSYLRADQISHQTLQSELDQNRIMGTAIPGIFVGVAVFLLHQVLGRMVTTQRGEIAILKAFGYSNMEIGRHFLMFAVVAVFGGAVAGGIGGIYLGDAMIRLYSKYFDLPNLQFRLAPDLLLLAGAVCFAGACSGAMGAVHRAVRLPPAEAMRPEAPTSYRAGFVEHLGLGRVLSPAGRMIMRNMERKPLQVVLAVLGVSQSMAILVIGMSMFDSITYLIDLQFRVIQREDVTLTFKQNVSSSVRFELARFPGVGRVETYRSAPVRLHAGHLEEETIVIGLQPDNQLRSIVNGDGKRLPVPASGLVLSSLLAAKLQAATGDTLRLEWLDGKRLETQVPITGINVDFLGMAAYMSMDALDTATGDKTLVSGAWLTLAADSTPELYARLKETPGIAGVASPATMIAAFNAHMAENLRIVSAFLLGFASIIAFGVIYNSARIALAERSRELASLRVMGFHRREVAFLLLGEQFVIMLLALPLGALVGYMLSAAIARSLETETLRVPLIADPATYVTAALIIVAAVIISMLAVRRRLDRIELVAVLKTRE
jgi:putative ABC transport system permease protein